MGWINYHFRSVGQEMVMIFNKNVGFYEEFELVGNPHLIWKNMYLKLGVITSPEFQSWALLLTNWRISLVKIPSGFIFFQVQKTWQTCGRVPLSFVSTLLFFSMNFHFPRPRSKKSEVPNKVTSPEYSSLMLKQFSWGSGRSHHDGLVRHLGSRWGFFKGKGFIFYPPYHGNLRVPPQCYPPPRNKALIRPY